MVSIALMVSYDFFHEYQIFTISSHNKTAVYVLSPLQKHVTQEKKELKKQKQPMTSSKIIDYQRYQQELAKNKKNNETKAPVVTIEEKEVKPIINKKIVAKNQKKAKKEEIQPKLMVTEQVVENKTEKIETKQQAKNQNNSSEKEQVVTTKEQQQKTIEKQIETSDISLDDVTFVGYEQLDTLTTQHTIQHRLQQHFRPPVGIAKDVSCDLLVQVSDAGKAVSVKIQRSSNILVYDAAARVAIYKVTFPQEVWNKKITISLGQ
tara:strand:- start:66 stop:854 length:789 start_codon:yes stop_codon:yes gene_type:complete